MNIKEYILSGIVELYAMNALNPGEKKEFERLMVLYPEIGNELNKTRLVLEKYVDGHASNPRPQVRSDIIEKIKSERQTQESPKPKLPNDYTLTYKYMIAASLAALVVSTFASWFFYTRWNEAEERYTSLLNDKNELSQNYNLLKLTFDESISDLVVMRDESSDVYVVHPKDTTQHHQARIYWSKYSHRTYIDALSLPRPSEGMLFQLWALSVNIPPQDAGVFLPDAERIQRMKDINNATSWIITMEPKGGSLQPSMERLILK